MSQGPSCLFCRIAKREIPSKILADTGRWVCFEDIHPQSPTHLLWVPVRHIGSLSEASAADGELLGEGLLQIRQWAEKTGLAERGYRVVINTNDDGGQTVKHLHFHLLAGRRMCWPPG